MGRAIYQEKNGKKVCTGCHKDQPINMYGVIKKQNGRHVQKSKCTDCLQRATEEWRQTHQNRYKSYRQEYNRINKEDLRVKRYRQDAKYREYEFLLTDEEIRSLFRNRCDYCGVLKDINGIDRVDSTKGYIIGNVVSCCIICNMAKKKMTKQEFLDWIKRVAVHQGFIQAT